VSVAIFFVTHFESVYSPVRNDFDKNEFETLLNEMPFDKSCSDVLSSITVALVDSCIRELKAGKASGPDQLTAEHLQNAHPSVVLFLSLLFRGMLKHNYVPTAFGCGTLIPLLKDKLGNVNDMNNYRGITLIPTISKLFELVLLKVCSSFLNTDDLQFGFKKGLGCASAVFVLTETVEYFSNRGSSVFGAALDIKKAFDRVSHHKMFTSLIRAGLPKIVILLLADWYTKLVIAVRWNGVMSKEFTAHSGVRQGSSLSPALFNVFINAFIVKLKLNHSGCKINVFL